MTQVAAEDTKARIRAVAVDRFTRQGYEQTSLREIADEVGMTKASLYYHYPSKQALLLAIIDPMVQEWRSIVTLAEHRPHTSAEMRTVLQDCLGMMLRHRAACGMFLRDTPAVLAAVGPIWGELIELSDRLHTWLAGPAPSAVAQIRAIAAREVLGAALAAGAVLREVSEEVVRDTLLDAACAVLDIPPAEGASPDIPRAEGGAGRAETPAAGAPRP